MREFFVGKVEVFSIPGVDMWFWSSDHYPPHFHAKRTGEWEIVIHILETQEHQLSYESKWGTAPSGKTLRVLASLVGLHREALYEEWILKTRVED